MVYSYSEIIEKYNDDYNMKKAMEKEEIYKVSRGIYSDKKYINPMLLFSKKYPNAVITMDSAFYYYNLTDVIPEKVSLATPSNAKPIKNNDVEQYYMDKDFLNLGKELVDIDNYGEKVPMYNKERLLIELIRRRKQIPFDYYKEIINNYREIADDLDMYKIEEYLDCFKNNVSIFEIMQREVF